MNALLAVASGSANYVVYYRSLAQDQTGKRFGQGNPRVWGFYGIAAHGIGVIAESFARGSFRNAVTASVPFLPAAEDINPTSEPGRRT